MFKKWIIASWLAGAAATGASAADVAPSADPSTWYVGIFGGVAIPEEIDYVLRQQSGSEYDTDQDMKIGWLAGGVLGARVFDVARLEAEVSYQSLDAGDVVYRLSGSESPYEGDGSSDAVYVLGNIWVDIPIFDMLKPYLGGGAGIAFVDQKIDHEDPVPFGPNGTDEAFAFQVGGGLQFAVTETIDLDIGYRFRGILDVDIKGDQPGDQHDDQDIYSHNVIAGLNFHL